VKNPWFSTPAVRPLDSRRASNFLVSLNHQQPVAIKLQVAKLKAEIIDVAFFVGISMGHVFKLKTLFQQFGARYFGHSFCGYLKRFFKQPPVSAKNVGNVSYVSVRVAVKFVVENVAAKIIAKFLIHSSFQRLAAL